MKTGKGCALLELWHSGIDNAVEAEVAPQSPRDSGWAFEYIVGAVPRVLVLFWQYSHVLWYIEQRYQVCLWLCQTLLFLKWRYQLRINKNQGIT